MNPVAIGLVWLVSLLIVGAAAWQNGHGAAETECTAAKVKPLEQSIQTHNQAATAGAAVERKTVTRTRWVDDHFRGLQAQEATDAKTHPLAADCVLDPARLRRWTAANAGPGADPAGPADDAGRSGPAAAGERLPDGPGGEPSGVDAPVLEAAGEVPGPGGVAGADGEPAE